MGYEFPRSAIVALGHVHSDDLVKRQAAREAVEAGLQGYESYKAGMRSGLFGAIIGKALFKPSKHRL